MWLSFVCLQHLERNWVVPKICTERPIGLVELGNITGEWGIDVIDDGEGSWISSETAEVNCQVSSILIIGKGSHISMRDSDLVIEFCASLLNS